MARRPRILVLYHFLHPDDVVSARHFDGLCEGLVERGWDVEARPSNRSCRNRGASYPLAEDHAGVRIRRIWRPDWDQAGGKGRIGNAAWMLARWCEVAIRRSSRLPDVILIGTDPILSVAVAGVVKRLRAKKSPKIVHWGFDLYPDAAIVDGLLPERGPITAVTRSMAGAGYRACDLIADIGPCMRARIDAYGHTARRETLVPWALSEPTPPPPAVDRVHRSLFGDARLGLLYSGSYGRAHDATDFLALASQLKGSDVELCFAVRGNARKELERLADGVPNVRFAGFCEESELPLRLAAGDIHLTSLRQDWTGLVVPSKFFGSLAAGRPVLFSGSPDSAIARWIEEYDVGWVLTSDNVEDVATRLRAMAGRPDALTALQQRCFDAYHAHFSRRVVMDRFDRAMRAL